MIQFIFSKNSRVLLPQVCSLFLSYIGMSTHGTLLLIDFLLSTVVLFQHTFCFYVRLFMSLETRVKCLNTHLAHLRCPMMPHVVLHDSWNHDRSLRPSSSMQPIELGPYSHFADFLMINNSWKDSGETDVTLDSSLRNACLRLVLNGMSHRISWSSLSTLHGMSRCHAIEPAWTKSDKNSLVIRLEWMK